MWLALDLVERDVGLRRVDAFVGFVDDEQVPVHVGDVLELVVAAAEVLRSLEVLQRDELDDARVFVDVLRGVGPPLLARHRGALGERRRVGHELVGGLVADEPLVVVEPGVGDGRAIGDDERPRTSIFRIRSYVVSVLPNRGFAFQSTSPLACARERSSPARPPACCSGRSW